MNILEIYENQLEIAVSEFSDIIFNGTVFYSESNEPLKLRLNVIDGSLIDIFCSVRGKYSYHWERRFIDGSIYRYDNAPHSRWNQLRTFPDHFHDGSQDNVKESFISHDFRTATEEFLEFVRRKLLTR